MEQKNPALEKDLKAFREDSITIGKQTEKYLRLVYPSYFLNPANIDSLLDENSTKTLGNMTFFRIQSCTVDSVDQAFEKINEKIEKLFTGLHSIGVSIAYGLVSKNGVTNLVLGVYMNEDKDVLANVTQGMLSGIEMDNYQPDFKENADAMKYHGILAGIPSLYMRDQKQEFSLSSIMRSLNGREYTLLFLARPVSESFVSGHISELISVRDKAFAVSKRNIARSISYATTKSHTESVNDTQSSNSGQEWGGAGTALGSIAGTLIEPGLGSIVGAAIGGGLGTVIGSIFGHSKSHSEGCSDSISDAITNGDTVSGDIQNGFALELMSYADKAIERLKNGRTNGVWQTTIAYSADSLKSRDIIKACLSGELSRPDPDKLPLMAFAPGEKKGEYLRIPRFLEENQSNPLCSFITSSELGLLCTVPTESVPDFEFRIRHTYPMVRSAVSEDSAIIGNLADGKRSLQNMPFALTHSDLNKHTFVCGLTGSGKTTTVKKILMESRVPFLVIESAKKEYRSIADDKRVFTLGRPEINCPQMNPFYVMPGVNLQTHIDYIKDLFNASFSFYGPMPYILEKCLYSIYENKGWDLTLGYHPLLVNKKSRTDFFDASYLEKQYECSAHKYLFPTMQDLKNEIVRYVEEELKYDGEVAGNVKTAMKVRLENLCNGAKGFSFNTYEHLDFSDILSNKVVFELEGLADDSDKAFSVGLLVIYINEFRQTQKELAGPQRMGLEHLLVIEEAHRLLKNVATERSTEEIGNPKGKAVEHFTNMIAEMRSYGQGVIIAEQIPSKLAPDVIKNSSNKIVQRLVSIDDQQIMANTIGMPADDAIQLGMMENGYAFCHKEGMALPTAVKIIDTYMKDGTVQKLDGYVSDGALYDQNEDFNKINYHKIRRVFDEKDEMKHMALLLLNTLLIESPQNVVTACDYMIQETDRELRKNAVSLFFCDDRQKMIAEYLRDMLLCFLLNGVYAVGKLPSDEVVTKLKRLFICSNTKKVNELKKELSLLYGTDNCAKLAKRIVVDLILRDKKESTDIKGTLSEYFMVVSDKTLKELNAEISGGIGV